MELGGLRWIRLVPEFGGNRDLPEAEQLSLEIERMRTAEVMAAAGSDLGKNEAWLKSEAMKRWVEDPEFGPLIRQYDRPTLAVFRQFVEHTRGFRNFVFEGREVTDPAEIFLRSPAELSGEITSCINAAARLSGQALKNFVLLCAGSNSETSAQPAPEADAPPDASTPEAATGS